MKLKHHDITFKRIDKIDKNLYDLLLLADPSKHLVDQYLIQSQIFAANRDGERLGVIVLYPLTTESIEIKNVAVKPEFQGQGIGTYLIENAIRMAQLSKQNRVCIGTANSSVGQLYLYQKLGFEITEIKKNFFIENYAEEIYENGIQVKHMLVLTRPLNDKLKV